MKVSSKSTNWHRHLVNPNIPPHYLSVEGRATDTENSAYVTWHQQDSLLFTWLLTTLSHSVLPRMVKCVHAHEIVDVLESTRDPVSHRDQLETILDGLPTEYQALASIIQYRDKPCSVPPTSNQTSSAASEVHSKVSSQDNVQHFEGARGFRGRSNGFRGHRNGGRARV
ncbi:hypothetical protein KIW84_034889 [Lathyrus oleraceus]|uniref:Uncharacterized protein n=1 Tax=Pisum sativum TaxID=3888 RepID=A0A9D5B4Y9_PEA|nr:hypothetical protein KIW84_034889 [Pisum sativum]